jgi:hypothetical protein
MMTLPQARLVVRAATHCVTTPIAAVVLTYLLVMHLQDRLEPWLQLDAEDDDPVAGFAGGGSRYMQQPQLAAGPWDKLAITRKLLAAIVPQLTACALVHQFELYSIVAVASHTT